MIGGGPNGIRMTSDSFFNQNKIIFDLIFIDGLHTAEQGFKDLINYVIGNFDSGVGIIKVDTKLKTTKLDE